MGMMLKHSIKLMAKAVDTVMGMSEKNSPTLPVMMSMGKKAAMVVSEALMTGQKTS